MNSNESAPPTNASACDESLPPNQPAKAEAAVLAKGMWREVEPTEAWEGSVQRSSLSFIDHFTYRHNDGKESCGLRDWSVVAATRRGREHADKGKFREDACKFTIGEGVAVYAVCDGAGSAKYSRIGSQFTAERAVSGILHKITEAKPTFGETPDSKSIQLQGFVGETIDQICSDLIAIAGQSQAKPEDFRCTLLLVIQFSSEHSEEFWSCQVGDGFIGAESASGAERWGTSDGGAFSGEVGCFIPDSGAAERARNTLFVKDGAQTYGVILATDGIEDPFYPIPKTLGAIFTQLRFGVTEPLEDFTYETMPGPSMIEPLDKELLQKWLSFKKRGENDDRTMLLIFRNKAEK